MLFNIYNYIINHPFVFDIQLINVPIYFYIFTLKEDILFLRWSILSYLLFGIGYYGLSAWSGVIFSIFSLGYLVILCKFKSKKVDKKIKKYTFFTVSLSIIIINLIFERETLLIEKSLLPCLSMIATLIHAYIYILSSLNLKSSRYLFIISHSLLIVYEIIVGLEIFAMVDVFGLLSNIIQLVKLYRKTIQ